MNTFHASITASLCLAAGAHAQTVYHLTDLGTLGGLSGAGAINNSGAVAGFGSLPANNAFRATRWNGTLHNLGVAGVFTQTVATAIGENGAVYGVGFALGDPDMHTYRFDDAAPVDLGVFTARGVNAAGDLVGLSNASIQGYLYPRPCLYRSGLVTSLSLLSGGLTGQAMDINDSGWIVGSSLTAALLYPRPVLWTGGSANAADLGTLAGTATSPGQAVAINAAGTIAGWSGRASGAAHATLWRTNPSGGVTQRVDLGSLSAGATSYANALNASEVVVGTSDFRAFVWVTGQMTDLNTLVAAPDWKLEVATGVNDAGWIVGTGTYQGWPKSFVLRPVTACGPADLGSQGGVTGPDGLLDNNDFIAFISAFFASDPHADLGRQGGLPGADGRFDNNDFIAFIDYFFAGCP